MPSNAYPLRISDEQKARIREVAQKVELPFPETMRKAIDFGLPELLKRWKIPSPPTGDGKR
jgi:hypothetical protein